MKRSRSSTRIALVVVLALLLPAAARAESEAAFQDHYQRALKLYQDGQYQQAIPEFQTAYDLRPLPRLLFNLGQAYRKLGRDVEALNTYERYLQLDTSVPQERRAMVEGYIRELRGKLREAEAAEQAPPVSPPPLPGPSHPMPVLMPPPGGAAPPLAVTRQRPTPVYRRWWLWTAVGVVAAGAVTAVLTTRPGAQPPPPPGREYGYGNVFVY